MEVAAFTDAELDRYHSDLDHARLVASMFGDFEAKGRKEGLAEGKAELVKAMHQNGLNAEQISQFTQLSLQSVKQILSL